MTKSKDGGLMWCGTSGKVKLLQLNYSTDLNVYEGSSPPKILFQILLCRTCVVYKFFAEKTRKEIEQTE